MPPTGSAGSASAARACRRSPGGRPPRSARSRPLDPPSSPTVTTAVMSRSAQSPRAIRSARNDADRPCPPPNATTRTVIRPLRARSFAPQIAMLGGSRQPYLPQPAGQLLGDGHAAVLATGTADRHGHVALALPLEPGRGRVDQPGQGFDERDRAALTQHVPADLRLPAGVFTQ